VARRRFQTSRVRWSSRSAASRSRTPRFEPKTVIPSRLLRFGTHGETWPVLDRRSLP
jgi:hypothetical protein